MNNRNTKNGSEAMSAGPRLLSIAGVSEACNISKRSVWRLLASGELKPVRIGRAVRVRIADVDALVARGGTAQ